MYSEKFFNIYFHEFKIFFQICIDNLKRFFKSLCPMEAQVNFFIEKTAHKQYNFHKQTFKVTVLF